MFSTPDDPDSVKEVRETEMKYVAEWIDEAYQRRGAVRPIVAAV
jgi:hypothetical protein